MKTKTLIKNLKLIIVFITLTSQLIPDLYAQCSVTLNSGGDIAAGVAATPSGGTLCLNSGTYTLSSMVIINKPMTIAASPGATPVITQTGAFTMFSVTTGGVTIQGLTATGFEHAASGSCSGSIFLTVGAITGTTITGNMLNIFSCGMVFSGTSNITVNNNTLQTINYSGVTCFPCVGTASTVSGNTLSDLSVGNPVGQNAYGFVASGPTGSPSQNITFSNNKVYNAPTWECFDNHGGINIQWLNNYCLAPSSANAGINAPGNGQNPEVNGVIDGNTVDLGVTTTAPASIVMVAGSGGSLTGGEVKNNTIRFGPAGCYFTVANSVAQSGNICGSVPETMTVSFTPSTFVPNTPNGVVGTVSVIGSVSGSPAAASATLSITGANTGGFHLSGYSVLQPSVGGTPAGSYPVTIKATRTGLFNSPQQVTATIGSVTTGVNTNTNELSVTSVYPNPFNTSFTISFPSEIVLKNTILKIYDLCGKEVKNVLINNYETSIDRGELQSGIYFYSIFNNNESINKGKLIIQ